jgi:hypothetical protein
MGLKYFLNHQDTKTQSFLLKIVLCLCVFVVGSVYGATLPAGFTETTISGLSNPTAMEIAPDGRIFVCQQGGSLRVIKNGALLSTPFLTLSVDANGERGLLGIAFDPNFAGNNFTRVRSREWNSKQLCEWNFEPC